jgi:nucleoside-diphosphate-sugar epimerase
MSTPHTVFLVGGTGRTGRRVMQQLLERGVDVRAVVRSRAKLPPGLDGRSHLSLIEGTALSLPEDELRERLRGCDAVISCLGHTIDLAGIYGAPRDLVTRTTARLCRAIQASKPPTPVKLVLLSSVSVNRPGSLDQRRGAFERAFLWLLRGLLPPARDNQSAADFLLQEVGPNDAFVQWTAVRPDTLLEGDVTDYAVHEGLVDSLSSPGKTNMANVARFMCELVTNPTLWAEWRNKLPVIVNASAMATRPE